MIYKEMKKYERPEVIVVMLKNEHVLCASGDITILMNEDEDENGDILW